MPWKMSEVAVELFHMVCKMTNGHIGGLLQVYVDVVLLLLCCIIREDLQQMELDAVFKRLDHFLMDCVMRLAVEIGPRRCTNLLVDYLVPLEKGGFVQQILVQSKNCGTGLFHFLDGCVELH